jgi:peptide/nickel transport system permease protein
MLLVIFVLVLEFIILRVLPIAIYGFDPAIMIVKQAEQQAARKADIDEFIQSFKLDKPLFPDQFISYFVKILAFDFGISFRTRTPVAEEILERIPNTVILLGTSLIISIVLGFILGTYAATNKGKRSDQALVLIGMMSYAIPSYILGILLLMGLAYMPKILWGITLFPLGGSTVVLKEINIAGISFNMFNPEYLWYMTLPLLALVIASFGAWAYYVRQLVMVELGQEYIVTARAIGLKSRYIMRSYVFRNVSAPFTTAVALNIPFILSGAIIIETIFSWHGLGRYIYDSVVNYDYPAIQAVLYIVAVITAISLFIADIIIYKLDPRVKS